MPCAYAVTCRFRHLCPSQVQVQSPHADHSLRVQSRTGPVAAHAEPSQLTKSLSGPTHLAPVGLPALKSRIRLRYPRPQSRLHAVQSVHCEKVQSTTSSPHATWQYWYSEAAPVHGAPPCLAMTAGCRWRCCWPGPHSALQPPHRLQSCHWQSMGTKQLSTPQALASWRLPEQVAPVGDSVVTVRVRYVWPPSQLWEHADQSDQVENSQSTRGWWQLGMQVPESVLLPSTGWPGHTACRETSRWRSLRPSHPHAPQSLHGCHAPSTPGLASQLHGWVSFWTPGQS